MEIMAPPYVLPVTSMVLLTKNKNLIKGHRAVGYFFICLSLKNLTKQFNINLITFLIIKTSF